jgi:hypothetical protein
MLAISSCVITSSLPVQAVQAQQQPAAQLLVQRVVAVAHRRLRHLRDQRLRVAQQQVHHRAGAVELFLHGRAQAVARPALCTTARLGVDSPPMKSEMPTIPSLPTTAISAEAPSSMTYSSDTMARGGKVHVAAACPPDSYRTSSSIRVETLNGTVMLSGFAKSANEKSTAEAIAWKVGGVKAVKNEIAVRP